MAVIALPKSAVKPTRVSPKLLILYSLPKVGKTDEISKLPDCLNVDADPDHGAALYESMSQPVDDEYDVDKVLDLLDEAGADKAAKHPLGEKAPIKELYPYQFMALDPVDRFELYATDKATRKYKKGPLNSKGSFEKNGYTSVTELPDGNGYQYPRNELNAWVNAFKQRCGHLIITAHVKDKKLLDKNGEAVNVTDIDLTGKMGSILCAAADAIGYMYRSSDKENRGQLMVSFETHESAVMGARQKYLAGKKMVFDWSKIYPDELVYENGVYRFLEAGEGVPA